MKSVDLGRKEVGGSFRGVQKSHYKFQALCSSTDVSVCAWVYVCIQIYISMQHGSTGHSWKNCSPSTARLYYLR